MIFTKNKFNSVGFTLIELLIAMAVSGIIMTGVYSAFKSQQDSYLAQEQVAEMQQNIRAGLYLMTSEIRMAGYDPLGIAGSTITTATQGRMGFSQDVTDNAGTGDGDGDTADSNENITYGFANGFDNDADGIVDGNGVAPLGRNTGGGFQAVAESMQALEFYYTLVDGTQSLAPADPNTVSAVQISILARGRLPDLNYSDTRTYPTVGTTPGGATWGPYNDNFRRRFQTITVKCRNMGL